MSDYCQIPLKNKDNIVIDYAWVDKEDFENVNQYKWYKNKYGYAQTKCNKSSIRMHQFIIGKAPKKKVIDHINGNKLDNRRAQSARLCSQQSWKIYVL